MAQGRSQRASDPLQSCRHLPIGRQTLENVTHVTVKNGRYCNDVHFAHGRLAVVRQQDQRDSMAVLTICANRTLIPKQ